MYKLKLGKHQIFVIDEKRKICGVFYNLNQALDFVNEENYIEHLYQSYLANEWQRNYIYYKGDYELL